MPPWWIKSPESPMVSTLPRPMACSSCVRKLSFMLPTTRI